MNFRAAALAAGTAALLAGCAPEGARVKGAGLNAPEIKGAFLRDEFVFLSWGAVPGAASYDLYRACPGGAPLRVANTQAPLYKGPAGGDA